MLADVAKGGWKDLFGNDMKMGGYEVKVGGNTCQEPGRACHHYDTSATSSSISTRPLKI
jgi:hypothetical protein